MNAEDLKKWMDGLNPGDSWVVANPSKFSVAKFTVVRKTPTQLVVNEGGIERRYRLKDGRRVGGSYFDTIEPPSSTEKIAEARAAIRTRRLAYKIESTVWLKLPLETLEQVAALIGVEVPA